MTRSPERTGPDRRALLVAGLSSILGTMALAGCRVRLEDDAPDIPFAPTREPVVDEQALLTLVPELRRLATTARTAVPPQPALASAHLQQATTLESFLRASRVPAASLTATPSATPTATSAVPVTAAALAAAELRGLDATGITALGSLTTPAAATVRSIAAYRLVAALGRGGRVAWPASVTADETTEADLPLLQAFRAATYAFEVAAARSGTAESVHAAPKPEQTQRARLTQVAAWSLARCRALETRLGADAPAPAVGYPVTPLPANAAQAKALAAQTFSRLELAIGGALSLGGSAAPTVLDALVATLRTGAAWGLPLRPFPGLTTPSPATRPTATTTATPSASRT